MTKMLAFYAVPAAAVLAVEMLKRDQQHDPYYDFPRSEVLQQLILTFATTIPNTVVVTTDTFPTLMV